MYLNNLDRKNKDWDTMNFLIWFKKSSKVSITVEETKNTVQIVLLK